MITKKDFLKKFSIYAVGNISSKLIMFLLYPIMTFYLLPSELGKFDLVLTIVIWLGALTMLNMRDGAFRFVMTDNESVFQKVIKLFVKILFWNMVILRNIHGPENLSGFCFSGHFVTRKGLEKIFNLPALYMF